MHCTRIKAYAGPLESRNKKEEEGGTLFKLQRAKLTEVSKLLDKALPDVFNAGVNFWAYGMMLLEYHCHMLLNTLEITSLMQQVMEIDSTGQFSSILIM